MSKLLKPFGVLWGTSRVESNFIDTSGYAFEDTCQNSLTIFIVILASEFTIVCCLLGRRYKSDEEDVEAKRNKYIFQIFYKSGLSGTKKKKVFLYFSCNVSRHGRARADSDSSNPSQGCDSSPSPSIILLVDTSVIRKLKPGLTEPQADHLPIRRMPSPLPHTDANDFRRLQIQL